LCYNCNEPYVRGHVCQRPFYQESADYINGDITATGDEIVGDTDQHVASPDATVAPTTTLTVSLHASSGFAPRTQCCWSCTSRVAVA
jgi:hypothetical protein